MKVYLQVPLPIGTVKLKVNNFQQCVGCECVSSGIDPSMQGPVQSETYIEGRPEILDNLKVELISRAILDGLKCQS